VATEEISDAKREMEEFREINPQAKIDKCTYPYLPKTSSGANSAPVVEDVKRIWNWHSGRNHVVNGASDPDGGHVARGIIVSPHDEDSWMVTSSEHHEIV